MKLTILALGAAVAGIASVHPCAAQTTIESAAPLRFQEGRLVSQVSDDFFGNVSTPASESNDPFFGSDTSPSDVRDPQSLQSGGRSPFEQPVAQHAIRTDAMANQPAPLEVLTNTPEVGMVPVYWPQATPGCCATPNPVASMMTRNWCTDGLWATYPCQNARQCQHIQQHTGGYNRYATADGASCGACAPQFAPGYVPAVNAYPAGIPYANVPSAAERPIAVAREVLPTPQFELAATELTATELPADVPTVPATLERTGAAPQLPEPQPIQVSPQGTILPSIPPSADTPVIARLPSATLR